MDIFCENSQFNYLKHTLIENYNESILTEIILLYSVMYLKFFIQTEIINYNLAYN